MKKRQWTAIMKCGVRKEVILQGCTEKQAHENPWDYAIDEREIEQYDWEIESLEENE